MEWAHAEMEKNLQLRPVYIIALISLLVAGCSAPATALPKGKTSQVPPLSPSLNLPLEQTASSATAPVSPLFRPTASQSQANVGITPLSQEAAIVYQRSGGIAGKAESWTIYPDGRVVAYDGRKWQVSPQRVDQVLSDLNSLDFFALQSRYMPKQTCCDRFTYELTVRYGDQVHQVTTMDGSSTAPPELWRAIQAINDLISGTNQTSR
jgi:hypothetical protein